MFNVHSWITVFITPSTGRGQMSKCPFSLTAAPGDMSHEGYEDGGIVDGQGQNFAALLSLTRLWHYFLDN